MPNQKPISPIQSVKPKPVKKARSGEEVRERNITWLLVLGVLFLLISGLVVATSTWDQMGAVLKVVILLSVAIFFLGLSELSSRLLKIKKTTFAFLTLGSLLLPIAIIGIGYFELLGDYLSLTGEGRYWLGLICTLVPLPLYARNAYQTKAKLFVWIFYIFLTLTTSFLLIALNTPVDRFFFLIMVYNLLLLYIHHTSKKVAQTKLKVFLTELPAYTQLNLIISTLFMLILFDHGIFYSFNILLSALIFMAMVFVYRAKDYQFVFIALFAYSVYQLTEHTFLQEIDLLIYPIVGIAYLAFANLTNKETRLSKVFYYASGIMAGLSFIYLTNQMAIDFADSRSWLVLLSIILIAATYIYLANLTNKFVFRLLAPFFIVMVGIQFWFTLLNRLFSEGFHIYLFIYAIGLFIFIGLKNRFTFLSNIVKSSYYTSLVVIILTMLIELLQSNLLRVAFMLITVSILAIYLSLTRSNQLEKRYAEWIHPISCLLAIYLLYNKISESSQFYQEQLSLSFHLAMAGLVLLGISLLWKKINQPHLAKTAFYTGQVSYLFVLYHLFVFYSGDRVFVRPLILLVGIGVTYWLVRYTKRSQLWLVVSLTTLGFYLSLVSTFSIETFSGFVWFMLGLPVLFLVIEHFLGKYEPDLKPYYFFIGQGVLALLVFTIFTRYIVTVAFQLSSESLFHPVIWLIPLAIYLFTTKRQTKEHYLKLSFYASLSMVVGSIVSIISYYNLLQTFPIFYDWIIAIIGLVLIWFVVPVQWKRRLEWYMIPLMHLILLIGISSSKAQTVSQLAILLGLVCLTLCYLQIRKWSIFTVIPLIFSLIIWQNQLAITDQTIVWLTYTLIFVSFNLIGISLYKYLFIRDQQARPILDWYSIVSVIYLFNSSSLIENIWLETFTLILFSVWFFWQSKRVQKPINVKIFLSVATLSLLAPYNLLLGEYIDLLPELIHAELRALPVFALIIVLLKKVWSGYHSIIQYLETIALIFLTLYLVVDALQSVTIWDALIIGVLSIIALLIGMRYQIKDYFLVGVGTLLFNLIYQTRPFWGNLPWWAYLLFAGLLFIAIASYNEWKKQQDNEGKLEQKLKQIFAQFKKWN
ncbi:hypothetical protein [Amphibacillus indicireducens]|uniref:DUF2157 domain-containing protein n=1 Tax=Amphibacillus indicireducens TaxID=1076330 RepID=A0ABP7VPY2_9BACI